AARGEDVVALGFDEGPKPADWIEELRGRGITVSGDVLREEARAVLADYRAAGGPIYNPRGGD
ncbi:MAG TPA: nucleoside deaminase, partial [Thiobacillaceae bacterium]